MRKAELRISRGQATVLMAALDMYSGVGTGDLARVLLHPDIVRLRANAENPAAPGDTIRSMQKVIFGLPPHSALGIGSPLIHDVNRVAHDIVSAVRHRLALDWQDNPQTRGNYLMLAMDLETPQRVSADERFPAVTAEQSGMLNLALSDGQARAVMAALNLYFRVGLGQLQIMLEHPDVSRRMVRIRGDERAVLEEWLDGAKDAIFRMPRNASYGIYHNGIDDRNRVAYDIYSVIRHRLAWDAAGNPPERDIRTMWDRGFDAPQQSSTTEPLPAIMRTMAAVPPPPDPMAP
jgi:hypothetical protein